ncbi:MAG: glycosyltransferase family 39 protein [Planctomycetes bacterium]|nr:glycosyltransferase family 39 protein [Planctomycetota bacterium]
MMKSGSWKSDVLCLGILMGLCLPIGIHQVRKLALINPDGVLYIDLGHRLPEDYVGVARRYPPGYPLILWAAHAAATRMVGHDFPMLRLYSALGVTLLCQMLALIPLYFLGKLFLGARRSFWALLILVFLPYPAQYAADVLREWPYVLFLSMGFWLLCRALRGRQWWMLALVGLDAGLGYLIRPECGQLVLYALLGLAALGLVEKSIHTSTLSGAGLLTVAAFLLPVAPHVRATGSIAPHQLQAPAAKGPPTISAVGPRAASDDALVFEVPEGELLELPVQASDALGAPLTFSLAAVPVGSRPVYEFRSPATGSRVWTANEREKYLLLSTYPRAVWGWEGIACYAYVRADARVGLQGVWRLWSPTRARHFYTIDEQEKELLLKKPAQDAWLSDGVVFYVWPPGRQPPDATPVCRFGSQERGYSWAVQDSATHEARTGTVAWYVHRGDAPPAGATIAGGVFRWRPTQGQRGDYQINIIGSDGQLESCQSVIIRVTAAPAARGVCPPAQYAGLGWLPQTLYKVVSGVAQDLMVVFFVPWLLGLFWRLRYQADRLEQVLIVAVLILNAGLILARRLGLGPGDDRRYALGMIALTIFYLPVGIEVMARWLSSIHPLPQPHWMPRRLPGLSWFHLLVAVGLAVCLPRLLLASPGTKVGYRAAAAWLQQNTKPGDVLAVPDVRISFYAQRQGLLYLQHPDSRRADYIIIIEDGKTPQIPEQWHREYSVMVDRRTRKTLVIYRTAPSGTQLTGQESR